MTTPTTKKGAILVTGANGGLGSAVVSKIVSDGKLWEAYHGVYTVRALDKATVLNGVLKRAPPAHEHDVLELDLSRLASVRTVADDINKRVADGLLPPIRALILNAGYQEHTEQNFTPDGFDMSFQCNYLSHWLLTLMLLQSMDREQGRIVVVGSWTHE
jgi:NAD(P)-dependent dehydrogenase (short-subunit alcohol dehydrogenase family)